MIQGLTDEEVRKQWTQIGPNELTLKGRRSFFSMILSSVQEPMILLLMACASIYIVLGEASDGILLTVSLIGVLAITVYQEHRSTRALEALKELSSPRALVLRGGKELRIPSREVVPNDILLINEGDRIAADACLVGSSNLQVDESLLTGESLPVSKSSDGEETPKLYASTLVTRGRGIARVTATGNSTEVGKIGKSLNTDDNSRTRLQQELGVLIRVFLFIGIVSSLVVAITYGFTRGDWPQGLLAGLATAMSLMPEEFPVVMTVFLALGVWRMSKTNVLVRQSAATENLGAITVLCVDKTGTLTMNEMELKECWSASEPSSFELHPNQPLPESLHLLIECAVFASQKDPFDPMEKAIQRVATRNLRYKESPLSSMSLEREYPLSPALLAMTCVWKSPLSPELIVGAKGAPEALIGLCRLPAVTAEKVRKQVAAMSVSGLRVLGVAKASALSQTLPESQSDFDFEFLGLLGLKDPIRPEVPAAITECYQAGIRVLMITGDHPGTASKIAKDIGLKNSDLVVTGTELEAMNDLELKAIITSTNVFARMVPGQKLRIINALKANNEVVAMTGDGVNDAPSLQWADVGIAMGGRGTDVAREAADLVLLNDCFTSIVNAIRFGRSLFDNIQSAISYIVAVHAPIAGLAIAPVLLGWPLLFFPAHIVFLELIIDPSCTLIFESEPPDRNTMNRPPRSASARIFSLSKIFASLSQGVIAFISLLVLFAWCQAQSYSPELVRTIVFSSFILANFGLIVVNHVHLLRLQNRSFILILLIGMLSLMAAIYVPAVQPLFGFTSLALNHWSLAVTGGLSATLLNFVVSNSLLRRRASCRP